MIMNVKLLVDILSKSDYYKESELIDIAKGKYQIPRTWKDVRNLFKRM